MSESPLAAYLRSLGVQLPVVDSFSAMRATLPQPGQVPPPRIGPAPQAPAPAPTIGREPGALDNWTDPQQLVDALQQLSASLWQAGSHPDEALATLGSSAMKQARGLAELPGLIPDLVRVIGDQGLQPLAQQLAASLGEDYGSPGRLVNKVTTDPVGAALDAPTDPTDALFAAAKLGKVAPMAASLLIPGKPNFPDTTKLGDLIKPARHLGPQEYQFMEPVIDRIAAALVEGQRRGMRWDVDLPTLLKAVNNDPDELERILLMHAATTPHSDFVTSTLEGTRANELRLRGQPITSATARGAGITMEGAKVPNINRALRRDPAEREAFVQSLRDAGKKPAAIAQELSLGDDLSGPKINAMGRFNRGYMRALRPRKPAPVPDLHAMRVYGVGSDAPNIGDELPSIREVVYQNEGLGGRGNVLTDEVLASRVESAVLDALRQINPRATDDQLAMMFADMWEGGRALGGLPAQPGFRDLMDVSGQLKPGAMLDPNAQAQAAAIIEAIKQQQSTKTLGVLRQRQK